LFVVDRNAKERGEDKEFRGIKGKFFWTSPRRRILPLQLMEKTFG